MRGHLLDLTAIDNHNPGGVADVFRYDLATRNTSRVTAVETGVVGITDLSPALSVASKSGHLMFSVFRDAKWEISKLDPDQAQGEEIVDLEEAIAAEAIDADSHARWTNEIEAEPRAVIVLPEFGVIVR